MVDGAVRYDSIGTSLFFTALQRPIFNGTIGTAMMPGSQRVWSRDLEEVILCDKLTCRHGTEYPDGLTVNHAPGGQSVARWCCEPPGRGVRAAGGVHVLFVAYERRQHARGGGEPYFLCDRRNARETNLLCSECVGALRVA